VDLIGRIASCVFIGGVMIFGLWKRDKSPLREAVEGFMDGLGITGYESDERDSH